MAKRFITPFAEAGDRAAMPDTPVGTDSNYQTGYPSQYEEDPVVNPATAKFVERDKSNQLYNDITANIKEWQEHVFPEFITSANNGGVPFSYKKNSIVTYLGVDYVSIADSNSDVPPSSKWAIHSALINDLSQEYNLDTKALLDALTGTLPLGKVVKTTEHTTGKGGGASYVIVTSSSLPAIFQGTTAAGQVYEILDNVISPLQVGYNTTAADMTTIAIVNANWQIMKDYIAAIKSTNRIAPFYETLITSEAMYANWVSGIPSPLGHYIDSTGNGFGTTGHNASVGTDVPFEVNIGVNLNAYPARLQAMLKSSNFDSTIPVECYNGGFDGESFKSGFGLKHWYNTWFRGLSGSNEDWSDVKMIIQGFGTSDSINLDDTATVIANYELDLECVIIDSFLRGVQPALQTPVWTVENRGILNSGRTGYQTITIINAIQDKLAEKYNLEQFSYSDTWETVCSNYNGYQFRDLMNPDGVHPNDKGHALHAGYLASKFNKTIVDFSLDKSVESISAGHRAYQTDTGDNIFPASGGGLILDYVGNFSAISDESYFYNWVDSEGNGKTAGEHLVSCNVFITKPTMLIMKDVDSNRTAKAITVTSYTENANTTPTPKYQTQDNPLNTFFSHKSFVTLLPPGLNKIAIGASNDSPDQTFGGLYLMDARESNITIGRDEGLTRVVDVPNVFDSYPISSVPTLNRNDYYNPQDKAFTYISLTLTETLSAVTIYSIYTHYNDVSTYKDSYNKIEILGDDIIFKTKTDGGTEVIVATVTNAGLNALLVAGAHVLIPVRTRFADSLGVNWQFKVDNVAQTPYIAPLGDMWSDGYGFDTDIPCRDISITSTIQQTGFGDVSKLI